MSRRNILKTTLLAIGALATSGVSWLWKKSDKGVPGVTYFHATNHPLPPNTMIYLNGKSVRKMHAYESDSVQGWVRCWKGYEYRIDTDRSGKPVTVTYHGKVELREDFET